MAYIVKRPINLNGKRRLIGEIIQDDELTQGALIRTGRVAKLKEPGEAKETKTEPVAMNAPIIGQEKAPAPQPRRKSRRKAKTEDGGDA